jgi:uncharacterized Zn-finger protein
MPASRMTSAYHVTSGGDDVSSSWPSPSTVAAVGGESVAGRDIEPNPTWAMEQSWAVDENTSSLSPVVDLPSIEEGGEPSRASGMHQQHQDVYPGDYKDADYSVDKNNIKEESPDITYDTPTLPFVTPTSSSLYKNSSNNFNFSSIQTSGGVPRTFGCEECGEMFAWFDDLKRHSRVHKVSKRYTCTQCQREFTHREYLVKHLRTHSGEKPYKCATCGKCFSQQNNLTVHARVHTGARPFVCELCGQTFKQRQHYKSHMVKSHGINLIT